VRIRFQAAPVCPSSASRLTAPVCEKLGFSLQASAELVVWPEQNSLCSRSDRLFQIRSYKQVTGRIFPKQRVEWVTAAEILAFADETALEFSPLICFIYIPRFHR
jgi:hypothetical protein